ncbi:MAG: GNAT family N-acetyltransferase [Desulfovibrio sp.]
MQLRNAGREDLPALETLCRTSIGQIYGGILPPDVLAQWIEGEILRETLEAQWPEMLVAELEGRVVGVMRIEDGDRVDLLWVDPAEHRKGIGRALLHAAEERIAVSHARAWLTVFRANSNARGFYEHLGWRETSRFQDDQGVDVIRMEKTLRPAGAEV